MAPRGSRATIRPHLLHSTRRISASLNAHSDGSRGLKIQYGSDHFAVARARASPERNPEEEIGRPGAPDPLLPALTVGCPDTSPGDRVDLEARPRPARCNTGVDGWTAD